MDLSVIICTYNRSANLDSCIDALENQKDCAGINWEIVIVDNNSSDDTAVVIKRLQEGCERIKYVFEKQQGLSWARNRGIEETESRYLAFIDDDIRVDANWLKSIYDCFERYKCNAVGGRIYVDSPGPLPVWIQEDMRGFLGHRDFGDEQFQMDGYQQFPFGGNMCLARSAIEMVGKFDVRMGRKGEGKIASELFKGEETDYFNRLADAGGVIYYEPKAIVWHKILPHQLVKRFFRTIHFVAGLQKAGLDKTVYQRRFLNVPLFVYRQALWAVFRYLWQLFTKGPSLAFRQQMNVGYFWGMIKGYNKTKESP